MKIFLLLFPAFLSLLWGVNAQTHRCTTDEYFQQLSAEDSSLVTRVEQHKNLARQAARTHSSRSNKNGAAAIIIPVVVHVMHNGQSIGTGTNISDAQIFSQIDVLNEDYRALNADTANVPNHFKGLIGDVQVEFCLASFDPEGNPTNGIDRVNMGVNGTWSDNLKPGTIWNSEHYLNIWVADISGNTLGYATFPGTSSSRDGVVIGHEFFGRTPQNPFQLNNDFDLGRTATHEVGHWLGLDHTFQGGCSGTGANNCQTQGDRICDTPPTSSANYGCPKPQNQNTCTETPNDVPDMWMNYMDYMDDQCLIMFTQEQAAVMLGTLNSSRETIKSSPACDNINLFTYSGQVVDAQTGEGVPAASILFFSNTYSYETFTDAAGTFTMPNFREGAYTIYAGKWGYMTVEYYSDTLITDNTGALIIPIQSGYYYDDFILDYGWNVSGNAITGMWERDIPIGTNYIGSASNPGDDVPGDFGEKCFVTGNEGGSAGNDDVDDGYTVLLSPVFDVSHYIDPYLSYYRWFFNDGGQGSPPDDELIISIITDTAEVEIETLDANTANSNQWGFRTIRIADYITPSSDMRLLIETSDLQGSGHIVEAGFDWFQIKDSVITSTPSAPSFEGNFSLYPNPASEFIMVDINPGKQQDVTLYVFSTTGKLINEINLKQVVREKVKIDISKNRPGVYFIKMVSNDIMTTKRFSVY